MADLKPSTWLGAGYSVSSNKIQLNTSSAGSNKTLPQITDALADPTTGDIREVGFALCEALFQAWVTQYNAGNAPLKMTLRRIVSADTGAAVRNSYIFDFVVTPGVPSLVVSE